MSTGSRIEWTDATWNPTTGCTPVSPGCLNCYAARDAVRMAGNPNVKISSKYAGLTVIRDGRAVFNGQVRCHEDRLKIPLGWRTPRMVFVDSQSDLFHEDVPFEFVRKVYRVIERCPQHTFQVLTKRPERAVDFYGGTSGAGLTLPSPPLKNLWLGTSCENQATADERIPHLLRCPAAVRFLSVEPLLGPVSLFESISSIQRRLGVGYAEAARIKHAGKIDWVIVGGESGPNARPMHPALVRSIRDQCQAAGVPFFFKQWGAWSPIDQPWKQDSPKKLGKNEQWLNVAGGSGFHGEVWRMRRIGKKAAGRELDGRTWDEMPSHAEAQRRGG